MNCTCLEKREKIAQIRCTSWKPIWKTAFEKTERKKHGTF